MGIKTGEVKLCLSTELQRKSFRRVSDTKARLGDQVLKDERGI